MMKGCNDIAPAGRKREGWTSCPKVMRYFVSRNGGALAIADFNLRKREDVRVRKETTLVSAKNDLHIKNNTILC